MTLYMISSGTRREVAALKPIMQRLVNKRAAVPFTDSIDELHLAFADLEELSNQYLLGYESTNTRRDDTFRKISVQVDGHGRVRARQGYRAVPPK